METLLRFAHVTLKPALANLSPQNRSKVLGNIDVKATDAFYLTRQNRRSTVANIKEQLVASTHKYFREIAATEEDWKI